MRKFARLSSAILSIILFAVCACMLGGCQKQETTGYQKNANLDTSKNVALTIAYNKETWPEMDNVITKFEAIYPNCSVVGEYIEQYAENLPVRLAQDTHKVDVFRTVNIQEGSPNKEYALNLISDESKKILDLSGTNKGLVDNFRYTAAENTQYAIPYGGEMRGMYVNTTLLTKLGLKTPTNRAELMQCCEKLLAEGYVPFHSHVGTFAQQLLYPYICNSIVHGDDYAKTYAAIDNIDPGVSEYFRDAYGLIYEIVEKGYFDYMRAETEFGYTYDGSSGKAKDFLSIAKVSEDVYEKRDDVGSIAFMPDTQGFQLELAKTKSDYHSAIEYEFILSPVGVDGGYAYLSPADGLAINNKSDNIDWALEFLNFFFQPDVAAAFAAETGKIPNTADALLKYDVPENRSCDVGQVTFRYPFYKTVTTLMMGGYEDDMIGISKLNFPEYTTENADGTHGFRYTLDDYIARLEEEFQKVKSAA